jgi:hypothetical protein
MLLYLAENNILLYILNCLVLIILLILEKHESEKKTVGVISLYFECHWVEYSYIYGGMVH